jgi:hypothetical protein
LQAVTALKKARLASPPDALALADNQLQP